ncbi:MAG: hypothetical protein AAB685_02780, partial [Patescibacteria group bacterium]
MVENMEASPSSRKLVRQFEAGLHILRRDISGEAQRYKKYQGTAPEICRKVIEDRWNGRFFEGGASLFNGQFWIRDFSLSLDGIMAMGFTSQARQNLAWAAEVFASNGSIGTTVLGGDTIVDFWNFSADSLPLFLRSLKKAGTHELARKYKHFLNSEIERYFDEVFDPSTLLVKKENYSTPKDVITRKRTCVANAFMVYLQQTLQTDYPFLANPFADKDLLTSFIETYWVEKDGFFKNDAQDDRVFLSADANVIPYWLGVVKDKKMHLASINAIRKEKLDQPFPLKYHAFLNSNWV